jgi:hypothetical protein
MRKTNRAGRISLLNVFSVLGRLNLSPMCMVVEIEPPCVMSQDCSNCNCDDPQYACDVDMCGTDTDPKPCYSEDNCSESDESPCIGVDICSNWDYGRYCGERDFCVRDCPCGHTDTENQIW